MAEFCQRVGFVHQLRKLATSEELTNCSHHRAGINQLAWRDVFKICHAHAVHCVTLHTEHTNAELARYQFAHQVDTAVAE